ncbi:MAG: ABC-type sugar transport system, periplasmic component [Actinomycetia bacterium]|nr:ABC-type sugar transport system, periplasmic component [Actinomycetes bacterium]
MFRSWTRTAAAGTVVALALSTGIAVAGASPTAEPRAPKLPSCPVSALKSAKGVTTITVWNSMVRDNQTTLQGLTDAYNSSQTKVHVNLIQQPTYDDTYQKYVAGLTTGDLPDIAQLEDNQLQSVIDSGGAIPAASCAKADKYSFSDFVKRVPAYFTVEGTMWAMPFNVSNPVFYYDKHDFTTAGLDPNTPPATLADVLADAKKLKAAGIQTPFQFKEDSWYFEQWISGANKQYVNNGNGRTKRATKVLFDSADGKKVFTWLGDLVSSGVAQGSDKDQVDNLLAIGNGNSSMTIDTSAALGTVYSVLGSGGASDKQLDIGVAPLPQISAGKGGVTVAGAGMYIMKKSTPAKQAAAWDFLKYLDLPASQATWSVGTGYIPIRTSAAKDPKVQAQWAKFPGYKVAYDQLVAGKSTPASAGPVIGPYAQERLTIINAYQSIFGTKSDPLAALKTAATKSNSLISDYNSRL